MGVEAVALFGHRMQPHQLAGLPEKLSEGDGATWTFIEDGTWDFSLPSPDFWFKYDDVQLESNDCRLTVEPRSGHAYFVHSHYRCCRHPEERAVLESTIQAVARVFESSAVFVVPDNAYELSQGCYLGDNSIEEVERALSKIGKEAADLAEIYDADDNYRELYGGYRFPRFESPAPSLISGDKPHQKLNELLTALSWESFEFSYSHRLFVRGHLFYEIPEQPVSFWNNYHQPTTVLFLGVQEIRMLSNPGSSSVSPESTVEQEGQPLKRYQLAGTGKTLEVVALNHFLHIYPNSGDDLLLLQPKPGGALL